MNFHNINALDEFGTKLMCEVRDDACAFLQRVISGKMRDQTSEEFFKEYSQLDVKSAAVLHHFLAAAVDACLVRFLHFLDANEIETVFTTKDEKKVDVRVLSDGLAGEIHNETGWIARFSRFKDRIEPLK